MPSIVTTLKIPKNVIKTWTGLIANIPQHWVICDGTNGTPDLRAKFVRGAPNGSGAGATGGADTVTLDSTMIPSHNHSITDPTHNHSVNLFGGTSSVGTNSADVTSGSTDPTTPTITINNAGSGGSHNNIPAYYHVIYIMKVTSD